MQVAIASVIMKTPVLNSKSKRRLNQKLKSKIIKIVNRILKRIAKIKLKKIKSSPINVHRNNSTKMTIMITNSKLRKIKIIVMTQIIKYKTMVLQL